MQSDESLLSSSADAVSPVIDRKFIDSIISLQHPGNPDLLERIIDKYIHDFDCLHSGMLHALDQGDINSIRLMAHSLKSGSAILGLTSLAESCIKLEALARNNATDGATELLVQMKKDFVEVQNILQTFKSRNHVT
jgi:two-component system sensor histidine kinase/response regulator